MSPNDFGINLYIRLIGRTLFLGPKLILGRYYHSCAVSGDHIVVAGGYKYYNALKSVEILELSTGTGWNEGMTQIKI